MIERDAAPAVLPPGAAHQAPNPEQAEDESIQHSLFGEILDWMLAPLLLLWPMSIAITYLVAKSIANQPFDHALEDAVTVVAQQLREVDGRVVSQLAGSAREILLARTGRLVSKEQLVDHLCEWGEEVSNNAIEVYVHRLRKKLEVGGVRIATVRGLGYCLEKYADAARPAPQDSGAESK